MYRLVFKGLMDFVFSFISIIFLSPIFFILIIILLINNNGSPFFIQKRPGKNEKIFSIIKFKTMNDKKDDEGNLLSDQKRLTRIGELIRKTSLDELPQLINVLKGDMSLIGPRPLLPEYLLLYSPKQKNRHIVKPGITGWAQVNGRNAISWDRKFELDIEYVHKQSFIFDFKILLLTIKKVFLRQGINALGQATTTPFEGVK